MKCTYCGKRLIMTKSGYAHEPDENGIIRVMCCNRTRAATPMTGIQFPSWVTGPTFCWNRTFSVLRPADPTGIHGNRHGAVRETWTVGTDTDLILVRNRRTGTLHYSTNKKNPGFVNVEDN